jgi:hypothetical protein
VKRKIILPLLISLAVVASMTAGTYKAYVTMKVDPVVGNTSVAELAFAPGNGNVSSDFITTDPGNPMQIIFNFGDVQPNSQYLYEETLKITNNKPYAVQLKVSAVTWPMSSSQGNLEIWHGGCVYNAYAWMYSSKYGGVQPGTINLAAHGTAGDTDYISFFLATDYTCPAGSYNGTVTFYAWVWEAP